jgi:hypothetical protein
MTKVSIVKMLQALNAEPSNLEIAIIDNILSEGGIVSGIQRQSLIENLMKNQSLQLTSKKVAINALQRLNNKDIIKGEVVKHVYWVTLTTAARIELLKGDVEEGVVDLVNEAETAMNELSVVVKREGSKLKKKTLKKIAKGLDSLAEKIRSKSQN